jgi:hypothetical protein
MGECTVRADVVNNRLNVRMQGFSGDEEMEQFVARVIAETEKLKPGFIMVSDIAEMKPTTPRGAKALEGAMQAYKRRGIGRIIRVVGASMPGRMQMQRIAQEAGIPVSYVASLAEAEALAKKPG